MTDTSNKGRHALKEFHCMPVLNVYHMRLLTAYTTYTLLNPQSAREAVITGGSAEITHVNSETWTLTGNQHLLRLDFR